MYFRCRGYHYYEGFVDYIKRLPLAPHRCRSAPHRLPLATAVCTQGTPVEMLLNYKYVAAEIIHTLAGSFGLVTVAPLTAITSGLLLTHRNHVSPSEEPEAPV